MLAASLLTAPAPRTDCPECALVPRGPCHWDRDGRPRNVRTLPTLASIVPAAGSAAGGTIITLRGRNLQKAASCRFTLRDGTPLESTPVVLRDADGTEAECSTPVRARPTPEDGLGGVQLVLADGDACAKTGAAKFRFYWYEATSVSPEVGGGGARVEVAMRGLASNGGRVEDVACRFGAHEASAAEAIDLSRGVSSPRRRRRPAGSLARAPRLARSRRVVDRQRRRPAALLARPFRRCGARLRRRAPRRRRDAARDGAAAAAVATRRRPPRAAAEARPARFGRWLRKLLPELPALHVLGAAGDEPAFADGTPTPMPRLALAPLPTQLAALCSRLAAAPGLADSFTLVGLGRGALLARAAVERCDGGPRVGQLLLLDGPQRGAANCRSPPRCSPTRSPSARRESPSTAPSTATAHPSSSFCSLPTRRRRSPA